MEPSTHTNTPPGATAGPLRRIISLVYDWLLLLGISFAYGVVTLLLRKLSGEDTMAPPQGMESIVILSGLYLCYAAFFSWCWIRRGQTLGMKSWRMQLIQTDSRPVSVMTCVKRCIVAPLFIIAGGIGFWWCWFDKNGDSLQDIFTGTRIRLLPKENGTRTQQESS
ncbi:MAG: RDD family protein [Porticoccaceae bacterium]|nr:RDD family protein [Pseudomonadales bacterium]MCP5170915.1 RDD family protein [Pseudomonadales bacterium]MCP5301845.1 RDD family protein [Pseudomonadales bacterium]